MGQDVGQRLTERTAQNSYKIEGSESERYQLLVSIDVGYTGKIFPALTL